MSRSRYLDRIRRAPILTREEEAVLMRAWCEHRCVRSHNRIWLSYERLAARYARRFVSYGVSFDDLLAEANVALGIALQKFSLSHNVVFATYAQHWLRARLYDLVLRQSSVVAMARSAKIKTLIINLRRTLTAMDGAHHSSDSGASLEDLADRFSVPIRFVHRLATSLSSGDRSLDAPIGGDDASLTLGDVLACSAPAPDEIVAHNEDLERRLAALKLAMAALTPRQRRVIQARWLEHDSLRLDDLAIEMKISRERVRQIENVALSVIGRVVAKQLPDAAAPLPGHLVTARPRAARQGAGAS